MPKLPEYETHKVVKTKVVKLKGDTYAVTFTYDDGTEDFAEAGSIRRAVASTPRPSGPAARCAPFRSRRQDALLTFHGLIDERLVPLDPRETHQLGRVTVRPKWMPPAALATERFALLERLCLGLSLELGLGLGHRQHSLCFLSPSRMPLFLAAGHCAGGVELGVYS
jgi:hypothetical protein